MSSLDGNMSAVARDIFRSWTGVPEPNLSGAAHALAVWPGAVIEYDADGDVVGANDIGAHLVRVASETPGSPLPGLVALVRQSGGAVCDRLEVTFDNARRWFECIALPSGGGVIVLGRDQTYDFNIRQALFDSRQRYRDLVTISSDFAFETDRSGKFVFVSPHGALGYSPEDLIGQHPRDLLVDREVEDSELPFHARTAVAQSQIWLRNVDGEECCLLASAVPVQGPDGQWAGARGLCHDVTHERLRDSELAQAKVREQVVAYVVNQIREEARPRAMLESAASMLGRATSAASAVLSFSPDDGWHASASYGEWPDEVDLEEIAGDFTGAEDARRLEIGAHRLLGRATWYHGSVNGAVVLLRDKGKRTWNDDELAMLDAVAGQLAIGLRQIADQRELERLSTTDSLTGLMNRRAFVADLETAMERAERNGHRGVLLFVDLDNFKQVNDTRGHETGDQVLREISRLISARKRTYDLVARLGGDEFVIWLDNADLALASRRADEIVEALGALAEAHSAPSTPLGASVGLAEFRPDSGESVERLLIRGDEAMYAAKRNGKNGWAAADRAGTGHAGDDDSARIDTAGPGDGDQNDD
ncbi:MAG: diguanylate cyclase [Alphaproteobacteria bacterium]|nr:diguanylate cyclase [Alphaproteobacteria bacterium]